MENVIMDNAGDAESANLNSDSGKPERTHFFEDYASGVKELRAFREFCAYSVYRIAHFDDTERELLTKFASSKGMPLGPLAHIFPPDYIRVFSEEQLSNDLGYVDQLVAVRLWALIESTVDGFAWHLLRHTPRGSLSDSVRKISGPIFEFLEADEDSRAEYLLAALKQEVRSSLKVGVGRFEAVLDALGYAGEVHPAVRKTILELSEIRHCIVHRGAKADRKLIARCPWLGLSPHQQLPVGRENILRYFDAAHWYLCELLARGLSAITTGRPPTDADYSRFREIRDKGLPRLLGETSGDEGGALVFPAGV
jgi:hypothetical protein